MKITCDNVTICLTVFTQFPHPLTQSTYVFCITLITVDTVIHEPDTSYSTVNLLRVHTAA